MYYSTSQYFHTQLQRRTDEIDGIKVLVCRQVDDFAVGSPTKGTACFIEKIQEHVQAEFAGMGIELPECVHQQCNGI